MIENDLLLSQAIGIIFLEHFIFRITDYTLPSLMRYCAGEYGF